jgi:hypothetical protein
MMTRETSALGERVRNALRETAQACSETGEAVATSERLRIEARRLKDQLSEAENAYQNLRGLRQS